jgi:hypothetical protein
MGADAIADRLRPLVEAAYKDRSLLAGDDH